MIKPTLTNQEIKNKYEALVTGKTMSAQDRGYEFELLIYSVLQNEGLEPRTGYKPTGEQVDGSFFWQGQTFLLEAKWVKDPLPASSIYSFKGKVDGKFHTSSGVFLSVNGYSDDVEDALKFGKSLNILLFEENDISIIFKGEVSFLEVLKFKLRAAGDTGSLKSPYKLKKKAEEISKSNPEILNFTQFIGAGKSTIPKKIIRIDDLLVFVEGKTDIPLIKNLFEPIKRLYALSYRIQTLQGSSNIRELPSLLNLYGDYKKTKAVVIILDNDQATQEMDHTIRKIVEQFEESSISVRPIFLFINDHLKKLLSRKKLPIEKLRNELIFEKLETFIQQIAEDYYDPQIEVPRETLEKAFDKLTWNFEKGVIEVASDNDDRSKQEIISLEELIEYLNADMISAMYGEMPSEWLKEQDYLDYESDVREYLHEKFKKKITRLGWNINDL